nr:MAG TPA: hypothetical protein [Caudoviricetes sp.]
MSVRICITEKTCKLETALQVFFYTHFTKIKEI